MTSVHILSFFSSGRKGEREEKFLDKIMSFIKGQPLGNTDNKIDPPKDTALIMNPLTQDSYDLIRNVCAT